ncbi:Uncharacterised protein [Mycobacterium tuberculosis]|nr:Uncharacterised protein [Mycobacterium tuberculosis]
MGRLGDRLAHDFGSRNEPASSDHRAGAHEAAPP